MALIAECSLKSVSPLSQSRYYSDPPKNSKETSADYETRTWRERMHSDDKGLVFIPAMSLKWCLTDCAKFLGIKIAGKGRATYGKHFEAGILCLEGIPLGIRKMDVEGETLFVPADGKHGSGSRVLKTFPLIPVWAGKVVIHILDREITKEVFEEHLKEAGRFIGLGRFRPQRGGYYGRFSVTKLSFSED